MTKGWLTSEEMLSLKRTHLVGAVVALSLALFAGCKSTETKPQPVARKPSQPAEAPQPQQPEVTLPPESGDSMLPNILNWDAVSKVEQVKADEGKASFTFYFTNVSASPVIIFDTSTTCDCTVADLQSKPWTIPSRGKGKIDASIDVAGKTGSVTNSIVVFTSQGNRRLKVQADIVK